MNTKFFLLIIFLLGTSLLPAQTYTLKESIRTGLENSKMIKISQSKLNYADAKITAVGSQMLPQIKFNASYTRLSNIPAFTVNVPFSPMPITISEPILNSYNFKFSLQQPLFTGFRLSSLKSAAEYNYQAAEIEYNKDVNDYAFQIQQAFWNFYKAQQILKIVKDDLASLQKHLDDTKNFLDNGLVTKNDFLKLEVQYSNTELKLIEAENNLDIARINFNKVIGIDLNISTEIKYEYISVLKNTYNQEEAVEEADKNREELKSLKLKVLATDENITASNSDWFPSVYLFGNFYYSRPNQRILPARDQFDDTWDVGVSLSWDIWNWGHTSSLSAQAEELKSQTVTTLEQVCDNIEVEVRQAYLKYQSSIDRVDVIKKSLEQAEENYRITKEKYDVQLATSSDLLDAETALLQAKTNLTTTIVDYELAKVMLEKSMGRRIY